MSTDNTLQFIEKQIDEGLDRLLSHQAFLKSASVLLNMNSYRRKWIHSSLAKILKALQLPTKSEQEKILALLAQLNERIEDLDLRAIQNQKSPAKMKSIPVTDLKTRKPSATKAENGARSVGP